VTTVTQILFDGTRIEERTEARFYRDSAGRIRREQTILGLPAQNPSAQPQTVVTIGPTPDDAFAYTLDATARTARRVPRAVSLQLGFRFRDGTESVVSGRNLEYFAIVTDLNQRRVVRQEAGTPVAGTQSEESLGTRQIEGVRATGRKTTTTIPTGQIGNDRPIEITDERWESPDLRLLLYSRYSDPRTGIVEFRLMNINRAEPPPDLFMVPPDYTILEPGAGVGGAGGRGGRGGQ
jgi:hypothetical protein